MKYKGVLLDIDNTLYSNEASHKEAIGKAMDYAVNELKIEDFLAAFRKGSRLVGFGLPEGALLHNNMLNCKGM